MLAVWLKIKTGMNINKLMADTVKAYNAYLYGRDRIAQEAQKYIDWDYVSCDYVPGTGLSILATTPDDCSTNGMPECVCSAKFFFAFMEGKEAITPQEFKAISV